ncbi:hypothetical protein [Candidatus Poriferisodalis sp.]|uniref:hypothetical protein n=1 Tax=Candidatus Poriferisodalis sp. TaxID=3101277 RepID=UPI003AF75235
MVDGWKLLMANLQLYLQHFAGQTATSTLPMVMWQITPDEGWALTRCLLLATDSTWEWTT